MASADVQGKFLWHELVTPDPAAAGAFYGKVLGWTPQAWDKDPSYTVLLTPKGPVGGMMKPGADAHAGGSSAHWLAYIGTNNVEETAAAAQRLGGRILKGASDIPGGGRYAVVADPQGGVFGVHTPAASESGSHATDAFTWHELVTSDHAAALRFYRELFGWEQVAVHDMGAAGPYVIFGRGSQQLGGMFTRSGHTGAHWLAYVHVTSASKAAEAAKAAGGRLLNGPHQVPGGSWIAQLADPHGAAIAVNQPQSAAESAQAAKPAAASAPKPAAPAPKPAAKPAAPPASASRPPPAEPPAAQAKPSPAAAPAKAAAPASVAASGKPAAAAAPSAVAKAAVPAKAAAPAAAGAKTTPARKTAAHKSAGRKTAARATASRRKKTTRPARKTAAARKRPAKKASTARSRTTARSGARAKAKARKTPGRSGAGARKAARGKRAQKRSGRR